MGINLKALADGSSGLEGVDLDDGAFVVSAINHQAALGTVYSGPIMPRTMIVKKIQYVPDVVASNAVTITCYKATTGALASGTALHTGTFNCQGTAGTAQTATLSTTTGVLSVPSGSRIGFAISGATGAAGSGTVTFSLCPA